MIAHYADGKECTCRNTPSEVGNANYAADHPNAEPKFNDQVAAAIYKSNTERVSSV